MEGMGFALQLTGMALGALIGICVLFIGLVRGLGWVGRRTSREMVEEPELDTAEERRMASIAMAAVMAYLEAERKAATGAAQSKLKGDGGK